MPMNQVILEKRREMGLTQEQIAAHLGVSTPAVSKWEKGVTCPDIALLPQLARLLKIDLNTLFCFREELTMQEISDFCKELKVIREEKGIAAAYEQAENLIRTYPHNEMLLQMLTLSLDGMLLLSGLHNETVAEYYKSLEAWYHRLKESTDSQIRNTAHFMLANRYIRSDELEKAQEMLDEMPSKHDAVSEHADKLYLQVNIYMKQGKPEMAAQELERALLLAVNKVQLLLIKLVDTELAAGEHEKAEHIAKIAKDMVAMFDLWECSGYAAPLAIATELKDKQRTLPLLRDMMVAALKPWNYGKSALYHRIPGGAKYAMGREIIDGMLTDLSQDPQYDFLRDDDRFTKIIEESRTVASTDFSTPA